MMTTLCVEDINVKHHSAYTLITVMVLKVDVFPRPFDDNCVFWSETEFCIKIVTGCASTMSCV